MSCKVCLLGITPVLSGAISANATKVPPTWRDLYASGQKLLRHGVEAAEVPGRLGIRAERWREICGACSVRLVALGVEVGVGIWNTEE